MLHASWAPSAQAASGTATFVVGPAEGGSDAFSADPASPPRPIPRPQEAASDLTAPGFTEKAR